MQWRLAVPSSRRLSAQVKRQAHFAIPMSPASKGLAFVAIGLVTAVATNAKSCGTWGLDCFFYALAIMWGTSMVATCFFWTGVIRSEPSTLEKKLAFVGAALTSLIALGGLLLLMLFVVNK
jgi:ABC-type sugar transport system permease subunit